MIKQVIVRCTSCDEKHYVAESELPDKIENIDKGAAFETECPWCDESHYATLV